MSTDFEGINVLHKEKADSVTDSVAEKAYYAKADVENVSESDDDDGHILSDARDLVTHVISVEDDPTQSPWTFRTFIVGLGLSTFGGVLGKNFHNFCRAVT